VNPELIESLRGLLEESPGKVSLEPAVQAMLLQKGAVFALLQDGSAEAVLLLKETALYHPSETICRDAFEALARLARVDSSASQEAICSLVIEAAHPDAVQAALERRYFPSDPVQRAVFFLLTGQFDAYDRLDQDQEILTGVYLAANADLRKRIRDQARAADLGEWILVIRAATEGSPETIASLRQALPLFRSDEKRSSGLAVLRDLASQKNSDALDAIFHLFLEQDYLPAGELALSEKFYPRDPSRRALFYFLTGQWEEYEGVDFDHRLLGAAYEAAGRGLRGRIVTQTRRAGRTDWIQAISHGRRVRWLRDMNDQDWEAVIAQLTREQRWDSLWQLAQAAVPVWSARILAVLTAQGWEPASFEGKEDFNQLSSLAAACVDQELRVDRRPIMKNTVPGCTCLGFEPGGRLLAAVLPNNEVQIVRFQESSLFRSLQPTPGQTWSIAFSPDGQLLASAGSDGQIRVWRIKDEALVKTLEGHQGLVKVLVISPDGRTLASGSFDHTIRYWRFPQGPELRRQAGTAAEVFALAYAPDGSVLASGGGDRVVHLWNAADGNEIRRFSGHEETITSIAINPDGRILASGSRDKHLLLWTFPEGRLLSRLRGHSSPVTHLAFHPEKGLLASGSYSGEILLWSVPDGRLLQSLNASSGALTGLAFHPDGNTLVSGTREGGLSAWEMGLLLYTRYQDDQPARQDSEIAHRLEQGKTRPDGERKWLAFCQAMARWKHRFDIEIESPRRILSGEYDIEIG